MNRLTALYHLARADFLERTRRYSFLVTLGLVVWLGYAVTTGILVMRVPPNYEGQINSAWVGALMTFTTVLFLGLFGFYLVKGSVSRDYDTGVGQIIATTPITRPLYLLGKWLSNFAILGAMVLILMVAGALMNLFAGEAPLEVWALVSPLLFIALPFMALVAALAVLFEVIGWLRGGLGNLVYFFLFLVTLVTLAEMPTYRPFLDFAGVRLISDSIAQAAKQAYPESTGGFVFQILPSPSDPKPFTFEGFAWTADVLVPRLALVLLALALVALASVFFDRFNTSQPPAGRSKRRKSPAPEMALSDAASVPQVQLTPLPATRRFRFAALYTAELKMLLKGHRWWWYAIALGLVVAQLSVPPDARPLLLAAAWTWIILLLSDLGNREAIHRTAEIVFSAPRPILHQLPAQWLAAVTVTLLAGSGAFLGYLLDGETARLLAWLGGGLFIPSLALALGVLTRSRKPFEVIYITWMYIILNQFAPLDFVGVAPGSPWPVFALLAAALLGLAAFARQRQLQDGR